MLELIFSSVLLIACILLFIVAGTFPTAAITQGGGPALYPRFLLIVLAALTIYYMYQNRAKIKNFNKLGKPFKQILVENKYWLMFVAALFLMCIVLRYLGFIAAAFFMIASGAIIVKAKNRTFVKKDLILICVVALVFSLGLFYLFENILRFPLPKFNLF